MHSRRVVSITRWLTALGILAVLLTGYRHLVHVNPTTVALTLVLYVLILAAQWELRYAVVVSIVATAAYNFFFLPPLGTFTISDPQNWLALFTFLGTGIIGSRLSQAARLEAATALKRQRELETLYLLSRELLQTESVAAAIQNAPDLINTTLQAESVILFLLEGDRVYQAGIHPITGVELPHFRQMALTLPGVQPNTGNEVLVPLRSGVRPRGLLVIRGAELTTESLGAIGGLVSITLDHAQAIENTAKDEANKESERLRTLILDSITHELRTPLTSIKGAAGALLADKTMSSDNREELISIVDEEADRLNHLVGQAVEMARIEAREVQMHMEPLDLGEVLKDALENCAWVAESHDLRIDLGAVPKVTGDSELLGKVFCNLLENAAKYSAPSTPIFVSVEAGDEQVAVSVADRGIGIDPSEQSLVFDRLYRSRTQTEGKPGTGMGLAISRAIIEAHYGELTVTSQVGQGSVFTFRLPQLQI